MSRLPGANSTTSMLSHVPPFFNKNMSCKKEPARLLCSGGNIRQANLGERGSLRIRRRLLRSTSHKAAIFDSLERNRGSAGKQRREQSRRITKSQAKNKLSRLWNRGNRGGRGRRFHPCPLPFSAARRQISTNDCGYTGNPRTGLVLSEL